MINGQQNIKLFISLITIVFVKGISHLLRQKSDNEIAHCFYINKNLGVLFCLNVEITDVGNCRQPRDKSNRQQKEISAPCIAVLAYKNTSV
jgi:hypothetical protein